MPYTIPNTFATREDTVRLSLLDQNFSSVATQINTLIGTVDLLGGGSTETFTALQNDIAAVSSGKFGLKPLAAALLIASALVAPL